MPPRHSEVRLTIDSRFEDLELVDALSETVLAYVDVSGEELEHASLAVREAAANAVEHGNGPDSDEPVEILLQLNARTLTVSVRDQGNGFDPGTLPDPLAPENLMKRFMDEVEFDFASGTVVTLRKHLAAPATDTQQEEDV